MRGEKIGTGKALWIIEVLNLGTHGWTRDQAVTWSERDSNAEVPIVDAATFCGIFWPIKS